MLEIPGIEVKAELPYFAVYKTHSCIGNSEKLCNSVCNSEKVVFAVS